MNEYEQIDVVPPARQFNAVIWLLLLLAIGWIIYEVTHSPAWAAMAMCVKFGIEDFRTAWWLRYTDPDRRRGRACCWLHIASGLWQIAIIGVAMVFLTIVLAIGMQAPQGNGQGALQLLVGALTTMAMGFVLSTVATYIALFKAWRNDVRPWLNGSVHIARRKGEWPPLYGHQNRVLVLVITTALLTCIVFVPLLFVLLANKIDGIAPRKTRDMVAGLGVFFSVFVLLPVFAVAIRGLRQQRFFAAHPADCWGEAPLPAREKAVAHDETW